VVAVATTGHAGGWGRSRRGFGRNHGSMAHAGPVAHAAGL